MQWQPRSLKYALGWSCSQLTAAASSIQDLEVGRAVIYIYGGDVGGGRIDLQQFHSIQLNSAGE